MIRYIHFLEATASVATPQISARLLCTNLPFEVTDDVLSVLFSQSATPLPMCQSFRLSLSLLDTKASSRPTLLWHSCRTHRAPKSKWHKYCSSHPILLPLQ